MTERYIGISWIVVWRSFRKKQNIHEEKDWWFKTHRSLDAQI